MSDQEDYDDAENWQAKYDNMLADIWNSTTNAEREGKISYYDKQGALGQFRDSGLDVDNDISFIRDQQNGPSAAEAQSSDYQGSSQAEQTKPEFQKVEEQAQSQQTGEDWYNTTANQVEADHPDWSTEELTDYMTNLVNGGDPEAYAKQIDNPVGAWQDKYNNMLADIANSSTKSDQQDKIDYYRSAGILHQFKESGFDTDNDISYITNTQNLSNPDVSSIPAVNNVVNAARDYAGTAKEDISKLREANDTAAEQRADEGFTDPNAAPMIEGDIGEPSTVTGAGETAAQKEALSQTYRDVVGKPAGYVAVTPYVPAPVRAVAGALYAPNLVHDVAETYKEAAEPSAVLSADDWIKAGKPTDKIPSTTGGKTPTTAEAVGKTIQEAVVNPVISPIKEAITEPGKFAGEIVKDPTKLWSNVFLPAAVLGHPARAAVDKVADTALDKVYQAPEEVVNRQAENINAGTDQSGDQVPVEQAPAEQAPVEQAPVEQAPVEQAPAEQAPVEQAPVEQAAVSNIPPEEEALAKEAIASTPEVPAKNAASDIVKAEESKADHHPDEPAKALWQMDNEEYDTARLNKLVPDYTVSFTAPHKAGVEAGANPETKTVYRERGIDSDDSFSHELRHVIIDNYLPQWYKIHSPSLEKSVQSYLGKYRPHDATHPEASWGESAQALVDEYFKNPHRLQANLPGIYSYFKRNKLDQFRDVDVSHRAIVAEALKEGKPVPEEVLQEYPDLTKKETTTPLYRGEMGTLPNGQHLSRVQSIYDVIGKPERGGREQALTAATYYTENPEDAKTYANLDSSLLAKLKQDKGPVDPNGKAYTDQDYLNSFKIIYGHEPRLAGKVVRADVNVGKPLDLTNLGEWANFYDLRNKIAKESGYTVDNDLSNPLYSLETKLGIDAVYPEGQDEIPTYMLLKNNPKSQIDTGNAFSNWARSLGYDSIKYKEDGANHYAVLNKGGNKNEEIERPTNEYPDNRNAENAESGSQVTPEVPARSESAAGTESTENASVAQGQEKPFVPPVGEEAPPQLDPDLSAALSKGLLASSPQLEKLRAAREQTAAAIRSPRELFSPSSVSPAAELSAGSLRELLAKTQRGQDVLTQALEKDRDHFERLPEKDRLAFINKVETGDTEGLSPYEAGVAKKLQAVLKDRVSKVRMLGKGKLKNVIDNYLPHIWKNPKEAAKAFSTWDKSRAKRPLEGSKNFLKQRHIPTTKEGMQWRVYDKDDTLIGSFDDPIKANFLATSLKGRVGKPLVPVTTNPIDLTLMKIREMDKYIMANHFTREVEDMGLGKWATHAPEPDWKAVNTLQRSYPIKDKEGKEHVVTSRFYAMPDAARIANNYLSPGLRGSPIYNGLRVAGNAMNQYQLGMSAFHLGFVTVDTMLSQLALAQKHAFTAANQLVHGRFKKAAASAGSAALDTLTLPVSMPHTLWRGNKMLKEWYHPESGDTKVADVMDALVAGGSRARMDEFYQAGERRFGQELQQQYYNITNGGKGKALGWAVKQILPWNFVRLIPRVVMEEVVPRAKLGVAANMMQYEMGKNPFMDRLELRTTARKVWDSTDNRLGQMVYDNLFWKKGLKDALMVSVRSVGWNVGTVREVGGGLVDLAKMPADLLRGKKVDFTHRTSYAAALTMGTIVMGAIITRLATGTNPKDYRDYFFPRIGGTDEYGNPLRVSLPSYAKDVYSLWQKSQRKGLGHAVSETVLTKTHPFWQTLAELYNNKDYFGKQIYTPTQEDYRSKEFVNNLPGQVKQIGKFIAGQFVPFSMQSLQKLKEDEGTMIPNPKPTNIAGVPEYVGREYYNRFVPTTTRQILPMVGVTPAPRDINQTAAEQKAFDLRMEKRGSGARTTADSTSKAETQIRKQLQSGDTSLLLSSLQNGTITKGQYSSLKALKGLNPLQQSLKSASVEDTLSVYKVATPEEQASLKGLLIDKFNRKIKNGTPDDRVKYHQMRQSMFGY